MVSQLTQNSFAREARSEWVRLRTLVMLRWLAIFGQSAAVIVAVGYLDLQIPLQACALAITASILFNTVTTLVMPSNKRLSENEALLTLTFDVAQLVLLLFLTGGLNNPFALLILVPVTISATALTLYSTLLLSFTALCMISILGIFHIPLTLQNGAILKSPHLFVAGMWVALVIGIIFLASYARRVTTEMFAMSQALSATQMAMEREQKLTALGGVVAAAAHEMGTPLATIKLVTSELLNDLDDKPELKEDIELVQDQVERLRHILKDMGRTGKDDLLLKHAPLTALVQEAVQPHENRGIEVLFTTNDVLLSELTQEPPVIFRQPEIIHGLRNLAQNAVDFATSQIWVDVHWDDDIISVRISDDGRGYPHDLLDRIGEPFISKRRAPKFASKNSTQYQGMGLGLFIAKTLLERTAAELTFANANQGLIGLSPSGAKITGAIVSVVWRRDLLEQDSRSLRDALGPNERFDEIS